MRGSCLMIVFMTVIGVPFKGFLLTRMFIVMTVAMAVVMLMTVAMAVVMNVTRVMTVTTCMLLTSVCSTVVVVVSMAMWLRVFMIVCMTVIVCAASIWIMPTQGEDLFDHKAKSASPQ